VLERTQRVGLPPEEAFAFYADARNLEAITPPWLGFRVTTPEPIEMAAGTLIEYRLRLHGIPIRWRTRIAVWEPPHRFVDVQLRGPYALWEHTHTFEPDGAGATIIRDRVRYRLPLGPLGGLAHAALVRRDLRRIFDFRRDAVAARMTAG
jgi:ligand-binding SRPBCC domain-containing protein